jgi:hypothetical protein
MSSDRPRSPLKLVPVNGGARRWTIQELQEEIKRIATREERSIVLSVLARLAERRGVTEDLIVPDDVEDEVMGKAARYSAQ